ncbi:MAG: hypothetical protein ACOYT7_00560 [Patescibacteria group bacterium]
MGKTAIEIKTLPFRTYVFASLLINFLTILGVLGVLSFLPPEVPLFYGLAEGEQQLVKSIFLVIPASLSFLIIVVNSLLSYLFADEFFKKVLVLAGIGTSFFAVITTLKIILLVGSF